MPTLESFHTYWSSCPNATCVLDTAGRILAANPAFVTLVGNLVGTKFVEHVATDERMEVQTKLNTLLGGASEVSFFAVPLDSRVATQLLAWRAWRTEHSDAPIIAMATSVGLDGQGQAHIDEILRAHQMVDSSPMFVVAIDAMGTMVYMNSTMLTRFGYTREEVIGNNYMKQFVPEREHELLANIFRSLTTTGQVTLNENHVLTKDGEERCIEWHGRPIFNEERRLEYFYGLGIDVTVQRRAQDDLLRSQQRLEWHFKRSPLGMIEWDRQFRVTDWNPAAERIFGYSREEAMGRYGQDLVVPEAVRPYVADVWESLMASRAAVNAVNENVTKDGRTIVCEWSNTTLVDIDGEVTGVVSLVNDVTDRKKEEDNLRERERIQAQTIQQLSVPIIDVWEGVIALPIVGAIDEARAVHMTEELLTVLTTNNTRFAILDLTGATAMDGSIAARLGNMIQAVRLVGSECLISGLGPQLARVLVELDIPLSVRTFGSMRAALNHALRTMPQQKSNVSRKPGPQIKSGKQ
ncbi:MAG TPA: PAS domain S-box protein [Polyangium sp.]|nr:PAS domain S-box protein [Polyangium sp.]